MAQTQYFLGGNTARGFVSFYDGFCRGPEDFLWVLKGGPGCGKSSFMRAIGDAAEKAGLAVEYALCSADPDSVDGVYLPALHTGYVDGTAPHVIEPVTPGTAGAYLDLSRFYDCGALAEKRRQIERLQTQCAQMYREAYARLAALTPPTGAEEVTQQNRPRRFARALSCRGLVSAPLPGAREQTDALRVLARQQDAILYQHPLFPEQTEAVYLPSLQTLYCAPTQPLPELSGVVALLARAKALHDEQEALYNPHVDFTRVYALANSHVFRLLREN